MNGWFLLVAGLVLAAGCGGTGPQKVGRLVFTANGEDFVRNGFTSEDGWRMAFEHFYINLYGPTAYQVVEQSSGLTAGLRHGGHPHDDIPEGAAHVALLGDYFLELKQPGVLEVGRVTDAPIGNYNRLAFTVRPATAPSAGLVEGFAGTSIAFVGTATKDAESIHFDIRFDEEMAYYDCGPNGEAGVLAEDGQATAEMTFHVDHIFGDADAGPPDTADPESVNSLAIGFAPLAALASGGELAIDQTRLGQLMSGSDFLALIDALRGIGHSGEAHCEMH